MDAGLEEGLGRPRRACGSGVTIATASIPSGALASRLRHVSKVRIDAVRVEAERRGRSGIALVRRRRTARRRRARNWSSMPGGDAVNGADEGAFAAAHHAEAQLAPRRASILPQSPSASASELRLDALNPCAVPDRHLAEPERISSARPVPSIRRFAAVAPAGEVVEGLVGDADDVARDEGRAFARAVLRVLEAAFPFQHRPAVETVWASFEKMPPKSTCPSPSERKRPARSTQG